MATNTPIKVIKNETGTIKVKVLGYYSPITGKTYKRKSNRTQSENTYKKKNLVS